MPHFQSPFVLGSTDLRGALLALLSVAATCVVGPPLADAAPRRTTRPDASVAILVLTNGDVAARHSELYGAARETIESNTDLRVAPLDVVSTSVREEAVRACAGDSKCFARAIQATGVNVDLLLTVSVDRLEQDRLLGLRLVDVKSSGDLGAFGGEVAPKAQLAEAIAVHLPQVFPVELWGAIGTLEVTASEDNAEVTVGPHTCVTPCRLERMRPGTHEVVVKKSSFRPYSTQVELQAGNTTSVLADLELENPPLTSSPWFWGAVGVGAIALGVGAALVFAPSAGPGTVCVAPSRSLCD